MVVWPPIPKRAIYCEKMLLNSNLSENIISKSTNEFRKRFSTNQ